jgi:hypothetical protein
MINIDATTEQINDAFNDVASSARIDLAKRGLHVPDDPDTDRPKLRNGTLYDGRIPTDLDQLPNDDVVELLAVHAQWVAYVNGSLSDAQAKRSAVVKKEKAIKASIVAERGKDKVDADRRYVEVSSELAYWDAMLCYLEGIKSTASNDYKTISRTVTVRGQDHDMHTRHNNIQRNWS